MSSNFIIYDNENEIEVSGTEAAWAAYQRELELVQETGGNLEGVALVDAETGEVLADGSGYMAPA